MQQSFSPSKVSSLQYGGAVHAPNQRPLLRSQLDVDVAAGKMGGFEGSGSSLNAEVGLNLSTTLPLPLSMSHAYHVFQRDPPMTRAELPSTNLIQFQYNLLSIYLSHNPDFAQAVFNLIPQFSDIRLNQDTPVHPRIDSQIQTSQPMLTTTTPLALIASTSESSPKGAALAIPASSHREDSTGNLPQHPPAPSAHSTSATILGSSSHNSSSFRECNEGTLAASPGHPFAKRARANPSPDETLETLSGHFIFQVIWLGIDIWPICLEMAGQKSNYGKRSHSQSDYVENGGSKRRNPGDERDQYTPGPDDTVYRYLCPGRKIGSIIGRGGEIVKQLRAESQSKIRIGETMQGCEERVITIFSSSRETNAFEDSEDFVCPAQDALFRVHDRLVADEAPGEEDAEGDQPITVRLLVPSDQIGCVIGKGGQIIQGIRSDTGAQIRILKNEYLPPCALSTDELLQITGEAAVVRKALHVLSSRLHENPSRSQHLLTSATSNMYQSGGTFMGSNAGAPIVGLAPLMGPYGGYKGDTGGDWPHAFYPAPRDEASAKEFSLRLVCPTGNIGGVIGKGGSIIKQIRQESRAFIKVDSSAAEEDDCIITISSKEFFEDPISPTIDAAVRLQPKCSEKSDKESDSSVTTRLLVPISRIGCLIGKGGSIITEMRKLTKANIRILSKENLPKVASEDDEMVQITGDLDVARNALVQVTTRLKANFFEREGALSAFPPALPYLPMSADISDGSKYGSRDSKSHGRGYSYSLGYGGSSDVSDAYGSYGGSQSGSGAYGAYGGYSSGRSGSAGLSGLAA
ncbi:hypothetical protein NE237_006477 [Protea cynaroides]|uniref:K Homology domain-containing protein n=1 Tax=Protea cynaroides TaxID=273540 RepID=A0A9Q0QVC7_9MAGN|nr:hypothetical protein NE237_006477 [Protea cynaroides]